MANYSNQLMDNLEQNMILHKDESYQIIGTAMEVHRVLGCGFIEAVYQEALAVEFTNKGIPFEREKEIPIEYKNNILSKTFRADFICFGNIILELKAVEDFTDEHYAQIYSYLKASKSDLGIHINFGKASLDYKRIPTSKKWQYNSSN